MFRTNFYQIKVMMTKKKTIKNYAESLEINYNLNWPYIPDHSYRILITGHWWLRIW